jgi:hypothetical protein
MKASEWIQSTKDKTGKTGKQGKKGELAAETWSMVNRIRSGRPGQDEVEERADLYKARGPAEEQAD